MLQRKIKIRWLKAFFVCILPFSIIGMNVQAHVGYISSERSVGITTLVSFFLGLFVTYHIYKIKPALLFKTKKASSALIFKIFVPILTIGGIGFFFTGISYLAYSFTPRQYFETEVTLIDLEPSYAYIERIRVISGTTFTTETKNGESIKFELVGNYIYAERSTQI